jgi:hypothetical protein
MTKSQHTPTPWKYEYIDRNRAIISAPKGANHVYCLFGEFVGPPDFEKETQAIACKISAEEAAANATFIVRACNAHDALVEALEALADEAFRNMAGGKGHLIDNAYAALKLAKEG